MAKFVGKIVPKLLDENLSDYPYETTFHGVKYLANRNRPLVERMFWIVIFIISISFLGLFVYKICQNWLAYPVMIIDQNEPTQIFEIPFPAVTICPQIKFKLNKFNLSNLTNAEQFANFSDSINNDFVKKCILASQICRKNFNNLIKPLLSKAIKFKNLKLENTLSNDWIDILLEMSPNFEDIFETCHLSSLYSFTTMSSYKNCEELFSPIITNEGVCFTFNTIRDILRVDSIQSDFQYHNITRSRDGWDPENGYSKAKTYPHKGIVSGAAYGSAGIKFVLNANLSDVTPLCNPKHVGYKITLHSPSIYPQVYHTDKFIKIEYGKDYKISVIPKTIKTDDNFRALEPKVRNCYFNDERKLKFYTFYNEENCRLECYANYSTQLFIVEGVPFSIPRESNTSNIYMPYKNYGWELPKYYGLLYEHFKVYGSPKGVERAASILQCDCLPECNSIHYDSKIMTLTDVFSAETKVENADINVDSTQTTIEIMFNEPTFMGQKRVRMYTIETMISDFGGLLGLFMGGSLLSLFELFYFLAIRNYCKTKGDVVTN